MTRTNTNRVTFENAGTYEGDTEWFIRDASGGEDHGCTVGLLKRHTSRKSGMCGYGQVQDTEAKKSWTVSMDCLAKWDHDLIPDGATAAQAKAILRLALSMTRAERFQASRARRAARRAARND